MCDLETMSINTEHTAAHTSQNMQQENPVEAVRLLKSLVLDLEKKIGRVE